MESKNIIEQTDFGALIAPLCARRIMKDYRNFQSTILKMEAVYSF
jgi:hypothetical protein